MAKGLGKSESYLTKEVTTREEGTGALGVTPPKMAAAWGACVVGPFSINISREEMPGGCRRSQDGSFFDLYHARQDAGGDAGAPREVMDWLLLLGMIPSDLMFDCPNCGEPIKDDASFCPHCGSDSETGWNPDVDYYSLELPEEDEVDDHEMVYPEDAKARLKRVIGPTVIALCLVLFVSVGFARYHLWIVPAALFLAGVIAYNCLMGPRRR